MTVATDHSGCRVTFGRADTGGRAHISAPHRTIRSPRGSAGMFFADPQNHNAPSAQEPQAVTYTAGPPPAPQLGIVAGTTVVTADGIIPVELLCPGDRIVTRNTGLVRLGGLSFRQYDGDFIAITARALGATRPETDTIVPAAQTVLLRGVCAQEITGQSAALVPAGQLFGMPGVTLHQNYQMTLVRLAFDTPQLVYADGLETICLANDDDRLAA